MQGTPVRAAYDRWPLHNRQLREVIAGLSDDELAIRPSPDGWPIWATVGHTCGTRVYWLCTVAGEPGADATPFDDPERGWEDDLDHPRGADELVAALDATMAIIERVLDRWSIEDLAEPIRREYAGTVQVHTRGSILQRMFSHEAYHCGELSQTLGIHGLEQIDLWPPGAG